MRPDDVRESIFRLPLLETSGGSILSGTKCLSVHFGQGQVLFYKVHVITQSSCRAREHDRRGRGRLNEGARRRKVYCCPQTAERGHTYSVLLQMADSIRGWALQRETDAQYQKDSLKTELCQRGVDSGQGANPAGLDHLWR